MWNFFELEGLNILLQKRECAVLLANLLERGYLLITATVTTL